MRYERFFKLLLITGVCGIVSSAVLADDPPPPAASACDPLYYDTLESRAWMEAQREIVQNQNLIVKPDSVLQYTCFDKHLGAIDHASRQMFSHERAPSGIAGMGALTGPLNGSLGNSMGGALGGSLGSIGSILNDLGQIGDALGIDELSQLSELGVDVAQIDRMLGDGFDFAKIGEAFENGLDLDGLADAIGDGLDLNNLGELVSENLNMESFLRVAGLPNIDFNNLSSLPQQTIDSLGTSFTEVQNFITNNGTSALNSLRGLSGLASGDALQSLGEAANAGTNLNQITGLRSLASNVQTVTGGVLGAANTVTGAVNQVNQARSTVTGAVNNVTGAASNITGAATTSGTAANGGSANSLAQQAPTFSRTLQTGAQIYNSVGNARNAIENAPNTLWNRIENNARNSISDTGLGRVWNFFRGRDSGNNSAGNASSASAPNNLASGGSSGGSQSSGGSGTATAGNAASSFIAANFTGSTNTLLGGRSSNSYQPGDVAAGAYSCNVMDQVWREARCSDFMDKPETDGFFTLAEYASPGSQDKRFPLGSCSRSGNWFFAHANAFAKEYDSSLGAGPRWERDTIDVLLDRFEQEDGVSCSDSKVIATGVTIQQKDAQPDEYEQKICLMAGCNYIPNKDDGSTGECKAFET